MERIGKALDDLPCLPRRHEDGLVIRGGASFDRQHRVILHELMQGPDTVDPEHTFRETYDRRPCQVLLGVKDFEPMLYIEGFDIVRYSLPPLREKICVGDM